MWKLHRYYLKEVATSAAITFVVLFGIVLVSLVYRGIGRAEGFGLVAAAKITFFWTADTLTHLLPIALLFGTVMTFARASQDREVTAIRSAGVSPRVVLVPALLIGIAFSLVASFALHELVPRAHYLKYNVVADSIREVLLRTGMMGDRFAFGGLVLTWDRKDSDGAWRDVVIRVGTNRSELGPLRDGVFVADRATVELEDEHRLVLVLDDARDVAGNRTLPQHLRISVDMHQIADADRREESEKDMGSADLLAEVDRGVHPRPGAARYVVAQRSCFALLPCLLAPIGFAIGVYSRDRGRVTALVLAMIPVFAFYLADFLGAQLTRQFDWHGFAFLPAAVLVVLGLPLCWRLVRV